MNSCLHELVDEAGHVARQLRGAREAAGVQQETDYVLLVRLDRDGADCGSGHLERLHIRQANAHVASVRADPLKLYRRTGRAERKRGEKDGRVG